MELLNKETSRIIKPQNMIPKESSWAIKIHTFTIQICPNQRTILIEDLREQDAPAIYSNILRIAERPTGKEGEHRKFYTTTLMQNKKWMEAKYELTYIVTQFVMHGFHHHHLCKNKAFHEHDCMYHMMICTRCTLSLTQFCNETNAHWVLFFSYYLLFC